MKLFISMLLFTTIISCNSEIFCDPIRDNQETCKAYSPALEFRRESLRIKGINLEGNNYTMRLTSEKIDTLDFVETDTIFFNLNEDYSYEFFVQTWWTEALKDDALFHHEKGIFEVISDGPVQDCKDYYWDTRLWRFTSEGGRVYEYTYTGPCDWLFARFQTVTEQGDSLFFKLVFL